MNFYNNKSEISTMNLIHDFSNSIRHNSRRIAMKFCKKSCLLLLNCTVDKRKDVQMLKRQTYGKKLENSVTVYR